MDVHAHLVENASSLKSTHFSKDCALFQLIGTFRLFLLFCIELFPTMASPETENGECVAQIDAELAVLDDFIFVCHF
jgi:hypothetical protein